MKLENITLNPTNIYPLGAEYTTNGIRFSFAVKSDSECGILLYPEGTNSPIKVIFPDWARVGRVCSAEIVFDCISKEDKSVYESVKYLIFEGEEVYPDPYMKDAEGFGAFGTVTSPLSKVTKNIIKSKALSNIIPFKDSVYYMLHVRGYTAHNSSHVKDKGTFKGAISKLPYIKDLGITSLILMPVYEFNEIITSSKGSKEDDTVELVKVNFWGYTDAYFYLPKYAFSANGNPVAEMHELVDQAHKIGLEVILQFCFPSYMNSRQIIDVLSFWNLVYGIDGFQLIGCNLPIDEIMTDPVLFGRKILLDQPVNNTGETYSPFHGQMNMDFCMDIRKFLKGDPNSAYNAALALRNSDPVKNPINFIARQDTMRAMDIVSYNEKHNENNGENGRDGADYNYSWNCGFEGPSRKKNIVELRNRQFFNAMAMTILGQGAPLIYGGDEFGNTQFGNNNPYNQDNATGYIKWPTGTKGKEYISFIKELIRIRASHPSLGTAKVFTGRDYLSYGFPDVSMHGEELWRSDLGPTSHCFGLLYSDKYFEADNDGLIYLIFNMHWEDSEMALPKLKNQNEWKVILTSDSKNTLIDTKCVTVKSRSFIVLEALAK